MNREELFETIGDIDYNYVKEAHQPTPSRSGRGWVKWGALAACVCLTVSVFFLVRHAGRDATAGAGQPDAGGVDGSFPEGIDPVVASIAVYPATEELSDVADATIERLDQTAAYAVEKLGRYLPAELPDGYRFGRASLYETTMQTGVQYHMLRVTYETGAMALPEGAAPTEDGGEAAPIPSDDYGSFVVQVLDHAPKTEREIYDVTALPEDLAASADGRIIYIRCGEVYVGISAMQLEQELEQIMEALEQLERELAAMAD